jgi:hypothetical protein
MSSFMSVKIQHWGLHRNYHKGNCDETPSWHENALVPWDFNPVDWCHGNCPSWWQCCCGNSIMWIRCCSNSMGYFKGYFFVHWNQYSLLFTSTYNQEQPLQPWIIPLFKPRLTQLFYSEDHWGCNWRGKPWTSWKHYHWCFWNSQSRTPSYQAC